MPKYELSDATRDFIQQTTIINNLWTVYVAATFAAAGFGITTRLSWKIALFMIIGFWLFVLGNLTFLLISISVQNRIASDIQAEIKNMEPPFRRSVQNLVDAAHSKFVSIFIHLSIDLCATAALLLRVPEIAAWLGQ